MSKNSSYTEEDFISEEPPVPGYSDKEYSVTFNQNRSFELKVGRKWFFFGPYSTEAMTEKEVNHPDFQQQSGYFNIKEI